MNFEKIIQKVREENLINNIYTDFSFRQILSNNIFLLKDHSFGVIYDISSNYNDNNLSILKKGIKELFEYLVQDEILKKIITFQVFYDSKNKRYYFSVKIEPFEINKNKLTNIFPITYMFKKYDNSIVDEIGNIYNKQEYFEKILNNVENIFPPLKGMRVDDIEELIYEYFNNIEITYILNQYNNSNTLNNYLLNSNEGLYLSTIFKYSEKKLSYSKKNIEDYIKISSRIISTSKRNIENDLLKTGNRFVKYPEVQEFLKFDSFLLSYDNFTFNFNGYCIETPVNSEYYSLNLY